MTTCDRCDAVILDDEASSEWNDHVVCMRCYRALHRGEATMRPDPNAGLPPGRVGVHREGCAYRGVGVKTPKGSWRKSCLLMIPFIVPGLIHFWRNRGFVVHCPQCGAKVGETTD